MRNPDGMWSESTRLNVWMHHRIKAVSREASVLRDSENGGNLINVRNPKRRRLTCHLVFVWLQLLFQNISAQTPLQWQECLMEAWPHLQGVNFFQIFTEELFRRLFWGRHSGRVEAAGGIVLNRGNLPNIFFEITLWQETVLGGGNEYWPKWTYMEGS